MRYNSKDVQLVPNTATDRIQVYVDGRSVTTMQGRVIGADGRALPLAISNGTLHVASLASGMYVLDVITGEGLVVKARFVKE